MLRTAIEEGAMNTPRPGHTWRRATWLLAGCILACVAGRTSAQVVEGIAAIVNDEAITYGGITERAAPAVAAIEPRLSREEQREQMAMLHVSALRAMVEEKLLLAEGARQDNEAFDKQVDRILESRLENGRRTAGGAVAFKRKIEEEGLTYAEYVRRIRAKVIGDALLQNLVRRNLSVSPAETLEYYREHRGEFTETGTTKYRQIFISADKYENRADARKAADDVAGLLAEGQDFATLAIDKSDGPHAKDAGLWESSQKGLRPKAIEHLIFSLPLGTSSEPVESDIGFTIIKVEERNPEHVIGYEEAQEKIRAHLLYQKQIERYEGLMRQLEERNYVRLH